MLYLVKCNATGYVKVGMCKEHRLEARMDMYKTHSPLGVSLVLTTRGDYAEEQDAHARLSAWFLRREWFTCSPYVAASVMTAPDIGTRWTTLVSAAKRSGVLWDTMRNLAEDDGVVLTLADEFQTRHFVPSLWASQPGIKERALGRRARGELHHESRLDSASVADARAQRMSGESVLSISRRFGVSPATMRNALNGTTWAHVDGAVTKKIVAKRIPDAIAERARELHAYGKSMKAIASDLGVSHGTVSNMVGRRTNRYS